MGMPTLEEFHEAVKTGNMAVVGAWLNGKGDIEQRFPTKGLNAWNETPLNLASMWGQAQVVNLLIKAGADVHAVNYSGFDSLMLAAMNGRIECCQLLVNAGANPAFESELNRRTALDHCKVQMMGRPDRVEHKAVADFLEPLTPSDIGETAYYAQRKVDREREVAERAAAEAAKKNAAAA
jgi:ankyrin repeat protein